MKGKFVRDWMTRQIITAPPDMPLPDAHRLMAQHRIRRLPVVDHDKLVGIVTRGDVRGAEPSEATSLSIFELNYLLSKLTLERLMTKDPITVAPDTTIHDAAWLMLERKISGLPVVEEGHRLVGIITESDIFRMVVKMWEEEKDLAPA